MTSSRPTAAAFWLRVFYFSEAQMINTVIGKYDNVRLHIQYMDVVRLLFGYRQTKKHSARQLKRLAAEIERHGFLVPILVDDALNIVAGLLF